MDFRDKNGKDIKIGCKVQWLSGKGTRYECYRTGLVTKMSARTNYNNITTYRFTVFDQGQTVTKHYYVNKGTPVEEFKSYETKENVLRTSLTSRDGNFTNAEVVEESTREPSEIRL